MCSILVSCANVDKTVSGIACSALLDLRESAPGNLQTQSSDEDYPKIDFE